jgi:hypothetical protein
MPRAHREYDIRFCGANTINVALSQNTVWVNGNLWAVEHCRCDHYNPAQPNVANGALISIYGKRNIYIGSGNLQFRAIVAIGDSANIDYQGHPFPPTDPLTGSPNVICYNAEMKGDIEILGTP